MRRTYDDAMNNLAKQPSSSPADAEEELTHLRRRLGGLRARRDVLTATIIDAEKGGGLQSGFRSSDLAQAMAMLDGKSFVPSREQPLSSLEVLHLERDVIDRALTIGDARLGHLTAERAVAIWANYHTQIAQMELARVTLALQLQATNRAREELREKIIAAGGAGCFHTDGVDLLYLGDVHDDVQWALARLVADKVCSRREIEKMQNG